MFLKVLFGSIWILALLVGSAEAGQRVLLGGRDGLALVEPNGDVSWEMKWGGIHDIHLLDNGNVLTRRGKNQVVEIVPSEKKVVWSYDSATQNGNQGKKVEVHGFQPVGNEIMIAESGARRILFVDRAGHVTRKIPLVVDHPNTHSDTRLVRLTGSGSLLVAHESDGKVREYDPSGRIVWEYTVPLFGKSPVKGHGPEAFGNRLFSATRLANGNTLIGTGNGHSVLEVTPEKQIVWKLLQDELAGIRLAWVTTVDVLPNGNYLIGNCHAGPGQPILIEIEPKSKRVVWQLDGYERFGNNVSNSVVVGDHWNPR